MVLVLHLSSYITTVSHWLLIKIEKDRCGNLNFRGTEETLRTVIHIMAILLKGLRIC